MKLIVGLGNPGEKYKSTRHNVGFIVVDELAHELGSKNYELWKKHKAVVCRPKAVDVLLAKPTTFMNRSGDTVASITNFYKLKADSLFVIHDDLDLRLGEYKIQRGKGPREHKGVVSIEKSLGSKDFWRIRVGIDGRETSGGEPSVAKAMEGKDYVLQNFTDEEFEIVNTLLKEIIQNIMEKIKR